MAMTWPSAFESALASSLISNLANRLTELVLDEIDNIVNVGRNMREMAVRAYVVQVKIQQLESKQANFSLQMWGPFVREITNLFYDVDDIIDKTALHKMKQTHQHEQQQQHHVQVLVEPVDSIQRREKEIGCNSIPMPPEHDPEIRRMVRSSLSEFKLPHKISTLLNKLQRVESLVDGLLATSKRPIRPAGIQASIPSQTQLVSGREKDKGTIINSYLIDPSFRERGVTIVGMAGLGKTTLAKSILSDSKIQGQFDHIIEHPVHMLNGEGTIPTDPAVKGHVVNGHPVHSEGDVNGYNLQSPGVVKFLPKGKTLLLLDGLHRVQHLVWELFCSTFLPHREVTLLITTTDPNVAAVTGTLPYHLEKLSDQDCKELIKQELPRNISYQYDRRIAGIAEKCAGLPLVAHVLGLEMRSKCYREKPEEVILRFETADLWRLEVFREEIIPNLKFQEPFLPPELNKFLAYFTLFPLGHQFKKQQLSQLWMAEGFVQPEGWTSSDLEIAGQYFDNLLSRSMLHLANRSPPKNIRHLSMCHQDIEPQHLETIVKYCKHLRTFHLLHRQGSNIRDAFPPSFFKELHYLRVVNLSRSSLNDLPRSISELVHLRYLDASNTLIETLPDTICNLLGLRIIKLENCSKLLSLPKKIGNLVNLIRLDVSNFFFIHYPPPNIGKLTNLQSLELFMVKKEVGHHITELGNMNAIRGSIKIVKLENVTDPREATGARLAQKSHLKTLQLEWTESSFLQNPSISTEILDALQPNNNLNELRLMNFRGKTFPNWLTSQACHLETIQLYNCPHITKLPPFWKLPFLKILHLERISKLERIDRQFFGDEFNNNRFMKLENLEFHYMENLIIWEESLLGDMPRLRDLNIFGCPKLSAMGSLWPLASLKQLTISYCPNLVKDPYMPPSARIIRCGRM